MGDVVENQSDGRKEREKREGERSSLFLRRVTSLHKLTETDALGTHKRTSGYTRDVVEAGVEKRD